MEKSEIKQSLFSLDYVRNTIKIYGDSPVSYDQELLITHLHDVIELIQKDHDLKKSEKNVEIEYEELGGEGGEGG